MVRSLAQWLVALVLVQSLTACAVLEIERDGVVVARRVSVLTAGTFPDLPDRAVVVSRERVLGLSLSASGNYLGLTHALKVQIPDPTRCAMVVLIDPTAPGATDWAAQLAALLPKACIVPTQ